MRSHYEFEFEFRPNKRPFPQVQRVSPGISGLSRCRQPALRRGVSQSPAIRVGRNPALQRDFPRCSDRWRDSYPAASSILQLLVLPAWLPVYQANKPAWGGARDGGKRAGVAIASLPSRWVRIFSMTSGSSMQAMILRWPLQVLHVSMSILNTRLRRCAQVIAARRSAGVGPCAASEGLVWLPLPRLAGVTRARCALLGANTPWNRVRLTLGLGTRATSRAMKSSGSKMTCVVPSRYGVLSG